MLLPPHEVDYGIIVVSLLPPPNFWRFRVLINIDADDIIASTPRFRWWRGLSAWGSSTESHLDESEDINDQAILTELSTIIMCATTPIPATWLLAVLVGWSVHPGLASLLIQILVWRMSVHCSVTCRSGLPCFYIYKTRWLCRLSHRFRGRLPLSSWNGVRFYYSRAISPSPGIFKVFFICSLNSANFCLAAWLPCGRTWPP